MIEVLLIILILETGFLCYLTFKKLPAETQKEIARKIEPINSEVIEWQPPELGEEKAFEEVVKKLE